jgi:molybdopterin-guanine dinucleotide biosynthesis protein A
MLLAGIFVGGRASRMGGIAKGLLLAPDGAPIVQRTRRLLEEVGADCVLVGAHAGYSDLGLEMLEDDREAEGPLAGLLALLERARGGTAIAIACDMPFVTTELVRRLVDAPPAPIVAPRRELWEPLCARYASRDVLGPARELARRGERRLQHLLDVVGARALALGPEDEDALVDWDTLPATMPRDRSGP